LPLLSQQPLGQLVASQTHLPLTQCWPAAQAEPVVPQTQLPLVQASAVIPHATQTRPLLPHAEVVVPATQVPLEQQPLLQGLVGATRRGAGTVVAGLVRRAVGVGVAAADATC
jgi:hypothetical protein